MAALLRVHPRDLLELVREDGEAEEPSKAGTTLATFDSFTDDLTHYLNSTEYLTAFLGDSLRQADHLLVGLGGVCTSEPVAEVTENLTKSAAERGSIFQLPKL